MEGGWRLSESSAAVGLSLARQASAPSALTSTPSPHPHVV